MGDKRNPIRLMQVVWRFWPIATVLLAATAQSQTLPPMDTVTVASGLSRPVFVTAPPGDHNRLFIVEQQATVSGQAVGRIRILNLQTGALQPPAPSPSPSPAPFLSPGIATGNEQGLLGLAFDPDYSKPGAVGERKFYIHYTATTTGDIVVKQYQARADNPDLADTTAANIKTVITFTHPQSNHNAGWIAFSPRPNDDHNLYISSGDGGTAMMPMEASDITNRVAMLNGTRLCRVKCCGFTSIRRPAHTRLLQTIRSLEWRIRLRKKFG